MTLVRTERDVRSYIWKNISRGTDNPTRRFCGQCCVSIALMGLPLMVSAHIPCKGGVAYILLPSLRIQDSEKHVRNNLAI